MEPLNPNLLTQTLNFHGQQLQKLWESERGEQDLVKNNVRDLNYDVYNKRNKHLSFQDRGKRLKLQQFVVKKANVLFSTETTEKSKSTPEDAVVTEDMYAVMPPLETYLTVDKQARLKYFFENVKIGDLILGTIVSKTQSGMMLKVLCTTGIGATVYYVSDINVKAFCPVANIIPAVDRKGVSRSYMMNDSVCCEVLEVIPDTDKMVCGMKGTTRDPNGPPHRPALGLVSADDFPLVYKKALDHKNDNYESVLEKSVGFNNPNNISYLASQMGIESHQSLMDGLRGRFQEAEYAVELRQQQASKWAYSNVADGIDHFKAGRHTEAFQCLNKALNIDPKNVEGLVARGALFANSGNFQKAIEDFETALKLNPNHANARKYMGETLVALGRSYEEENKIEDARKAYQSCLAIIPFHEEAQNSLEFLKSKSQTKNLIEPNELLLPNLGVGVAKQPDVHDTLKQLLKGEEEEKKEKKKKKKSKKKKSRRRSSSTSSSSSSGSNDSSSSSSSSSSDSSSSSGGSDFKKHKKRRSQSHRREKQSSLSPLSKRMALMDPSHEAPMNYQFNKPAASNTFDFSFEQAEQPKAPEPDDYEHKVRAFLEQTKGDSDYEDKVRKFLEESTKWKKEKRNEEKKKKKKKDIDELMAETEEKQDDKENVDENSSQWLSSDRDYTYEELLNRVFEIMRDKNPDMVAGKKQKFVMRPPQVVRIGTKKTSFANFTEICKTLHRQPKHLLDFLLAELGTSGSVDGNSQLIIKGRFQQKQIENVLRRYIKEYVTCHTCRSPDTILQKDTRLFFLQCETCGSRCSVASIKSGFQAVTSKRAAIRAKTA